ncbi:MAG: hypothetical protein ACOCP8_09350 [archaeon]
MGNLIIGIIIGAIFSPLLIKLFKIGWKAIEKNIKNLDKEV